MSSSQKLYIFLYLITGLVSYNTIIPHGVEPVSAATQITTTDELHSALTAKNPTVILLKMDHCPHCHSLLPVFEKHARKAWGKNMNFVIADGPKLQAATTIKNLTNNSIKIPGYPCIMYVKNNTIIDHQIGGNSKTFEEKIQKFSKKS